MSDPYGSLGISEESLEEDQKTTGEETPGMESLSGRIGKPVIPDSVKTYAFFEKESEDAQMCGGYGRRKEEPLLVRTSDGKNFRIYMNSNMWFQSSYVNKLCRFLDSRKPGETVTFVLGTKMSDWQSHILGSLISAMQTCAADITCIVAGYCGICETIIWCFGKHRLVYRYGALTFGHTKIVKDCPVYMNYFDVFYKQAVAIGVLAEEEAKELKDKGSTMMLLSHEIVSRINQSQQQAQ